MSAKETSFTIQGQKIAAKVWNHEKGLPTLALHGWLDNAASFDRLAPLLPNLHIIAIDLPGHGHSDHESPSTVIHLIDFVVDAIQIANHLGWERFVLLGHSLGAAISSLIAGTIPQRIQGVALIDALGPLTTPAEDAPFQLQLFVEEMRSKPNKKPPRYASPLDALKARLKVNMMETGSGELLVNRGLKLCENGEWTWRTDPRLLMPSALQLTEEQALAFLKAIVSPLCIVRPEPGYPFPTEIVQRRLMAVKHAKVLRLPGQHHVHLDDPAGVAALIQPFLNDLQK